MSQLKKRITIVIPVYNEEKSIAELYERLCEVTQKYGEYIFSALFVDDGSTDNTARVIQRLGKNSELYPGSPRINYIQFTRNFGKEIATSAGIAHVRGDACILMDADLQHPPELIPRFLEKWKQGAEVVTGIRGEYSGINIFIKLSGYMFYKILGAISDTKIIPYATDYRLLDRVVIDAYNSFTERSRITRGLIDWLGFSTEYVHFTPPPRIHGHARYTATKRLRLAISTFIAHSLFPLKIAGHLGITITLISGALGFFILIEKYILGDPKGFNFSGPAILAVIILFLIGIVLSCLGLIALYIGNIHTEVAKRPLYVVRTKKLK